MTRTLLFGAAALILAGCHREPPRPVPDASGVLPWSLEPSGKVASSPELLELGRGIFQKQCAACHGTDGGGNGTAAYLLYPRPRDFVRARYRLVSTWESVPTDEDIYRTISRGKPGSAMPSWAHLPERDRWALVHYLKSLAAEPLVVFRELGDRRDLVGRVVVAERAGYVEREVAALKLGRDQLGIRREDEDAAGQRQRVNVEFPSR